MTEVAGDERLYLMVVRRLEEDIDAGRLLAGTRLASERLLCERLGVSRDTLRRGLAELDRRGRIDPAPRRGWFVAGERVHEALGAPQSLTSWAEANGRVLVSRVVDASTRGASAAEAAALDVAPGEPVFSLERVRVVDGEALSVDRSCVPLARAPFLPELDFTTASLYAALAERAGIVPARAEYEVAAALADERTSHLLGIERGAALLRVVETAYDASGRPFEHLRSSNRGDRYRYRTTLLTHHPDGA